MPTMVARCILIVGLSCAASCTQPSLPKSTEASASKTGHCARIVSLAPSITEILFAAGLADQIVGVTDYCVYPQAATRIASIGGYATPNMEAIVSKEPTLVVALSEHVDAKNYLEELGLSVLSVDHRSANGILNSVAMLSKTCGNPPQTESLLQELRGILVRIGAKGAAATRKPSVLVTVGRHSSTDLSGGTYISGNGSIHSDLISRAGGRNAYTGSVSYPTISREGLLHLNPDIIIDLIPDLKSSPKMRNKVLNGWKAVGPLKAVAENKVFLVNQQEAVVPGPRLIRLLPRIFDMLHKNDTLGTTTP